MENDEKRAVVISAADSAVKLVAGDDDAHVIKLGSSTEKHLDLQPIIRGYGPTSNTVMKFVGELANILRKESPGLWGNISVKEHDYRFFAEVDIK